MLIIPVLDLRQGKAVQAGCGDRRRYPLLKSIYGDPSDPSTLIANIVGGGNGNQIYVADLTAFLDEHRDPRLYDLLDKSAAEIWLDAAFRCVDDIRKVIAGTCRIRPVLGTETFDFASGWSTAQGTDFISKCLLSLDFKSGEMLCARDDPQHQNPEKLIGAAYERGIRDLIIIDLERVGRSTGPGSDWPFPQWKRLFPELNFYFGGGVRSKSDIERLRAEGIQGVLVGTAFHSGHV